MYNTRIFIEWLVYILSLSCQMASYPEFMVQLSSNQSPLHRTAVGVCVQQRAIQF